MRKQVVKMEARLSRVHWGPVLKTAVLLYIVTFILGLALSFPLLAFLHWGQLNSHSAFQVSSLISALLLISALPSSRNAQGFGNGGLVPTLLVQFPGPSPATFLPTAGGIR